MEELIPIFLFICTAAVLILRPLSTRTGKLLEAMAKEKTAARVDDAESARTRVLLEHISRRLDLIEERLDFTERLVSSSRRPAAFGAGRLDALAATQRDTVMERETDYIAR